MAPKRILAVGVGEDRGNEETLIGHAKRAKGLKNMKVRPYVDGLIQGLDAFGHRLGDDYVIRFRQKEAANLNAATFQLGGAPYVILCMSTNVVRAAADAYAPATNRPIVGVVSEPDYERNTAGAVFDTLTNVCGISAQRVQTADACYERFLRAIDTLRTVHVLHKAGYGPSERALAKVQAVVTQPQNLNVVPVTTYANLMGDLNALPQQDPDSATDHGVFVLPIDVCLGHAQEVIDFVQKVKGMPVFFPIPDWVKSDGTGAFGAYGLSQRRSGMLMAERVHAIWNNGDTVPGGGFARWISAPLASFDFRVSQAVAEDQNIKLDRSIPRI
jgi:hypothetical protein